MITILLIRAIQLNYPFGFCYTTSFVAIRIENRGWWGAMKWQAKVQVKLKHSQMIWVEGFYLFWSFIYVLQNIVKAKAILSWKYFRGALAPMFITYLKAENSQENFCGKLKNRESIAQRILPCWRYSYFPVGQAYITLALAIYTLIQRVVLHPLQQVV